jgi:hypothetical protein
MPASSADGRATPGPAQPAVSTPWGSLGRGQVAELAAPGVVIGLLSGAIAGGISLAGGLGVDVAVISGVALGVPLAVAGAGYEILLAQGRVALSMLTPVALYWAVAFPLGRVLEAAVVDLYAGSAVAVPHGWLDYVVYQALVSVGFGIGYWWLHENFAPRWWFHIRGRNPVADHFVRAKLQYAEAAEAERESRRKRQEDKRAERRR